VHTLLLLCHHRWYWRMFLSATNQYSFFRLEQKSK